MTGSSGPQSTEFSYLFSFFPHSLPNSHFFSWFSSQSSGSLFTEFSHLFSFFLTVYRILTSFLVFSSLLRCFGAISRPIRSRHVDPVEFVVQLTPVDHGNFTSFLGFSWGICLSRDNFSRTSRPIRLRHVDPVDICGCQIGREWWWGGARGVSDCRFGSQESRSNCLRTLFCQLQGLSLRVTQTMFPGLDTFDRGNISLTRPYVSLLE